jgi:hypothetical protein
MATQTAIPRPGHRAPTLPWLYVAELADRLDQVAEDAPSPARRGYYLGLLAVLDAMGRDEVAAGSEAGAVLALVHRALCAGPEARAAL